MRLVIVPGNGCDDIMSANWYGWMQQRMQREAKFDEVVAQTMPDPNLARRQIWLPFMLSTLAVDASTVVVGHSSGAVAAMRFCEEHRVHGLVLVAACHTDLGEPTETQAGYYPPSGGEWQWDAIRENTAGNILLLHSNNDPFIPLCEPRHIAEQLKVELREIPGRSHFFEPGEDLVEAVYAVQAGVGSAENDNDE